MNAVVKDRAAVPNLKDARLFRESAYVDGAWVEADSRARFEGDNPATGAVVGHVPNMGAAETKRAIAAAEAALPAWRALTAKERSRILRKWFDLIVANVDDLALLLTTEQGKPLAESKGEIIYGASFVEWYAEEAKRVYGDVIPSPTNDRRIIVIKQPIGVVGAIHLRAEARGADAVLGARAGGARRARRNAQGRAEHHHRRSGRDRPGAL